MRKDAREAVLVLLYGDLYTDPREADDVNAFLRERKLDAADVNFARGLYAKVRDHEDELLETIGEMAKGFKLNRIFPVDKCALLIGMCELTYSPDVPSIVAIDEAVNLSRKYSTEKSSDFVNGILAEYKKRLEGTPV